jgi:hypothetical protein
LVSTKEIDMNAAIETASRKVDAIDKRIDAVRTELFRVAPVADEFSPADWQASWNRHPVLRAIERELYIRRLHASAVRDDLIARKAKAEERAEMRAFRKAAALKTCPACGQIAA